MASRAMSFDRSNFQVTLAIVVAIVSRVFFLARHFLLPSPALFSAYRVDGARFPFGVPLLVSRDRLTARGPFIIISNANENRILRGTPG